MADNTSSLIVVTQKIYDILEANLVAIETDANDLYWGDQTKIPRVRACCVDPVEQTIGLTGAGATPRIDIIHEVHIILYSAMMTDSQTNRKESDNYAEQVKNVLHTPGLGLTNSIGNNGVVLSGNVIRVNFGYAKRGTLRAARLVWQGMSKTSIVPVP